MTKKFLFNPIPGWSIGPKMQLQNRISPDHSLICEKDFTRETLLHPLHSQGYF